MDHELEHGLIGNKKKPSLQPWLESFGGASISHASPSRAFYDIFP
jgi:hypothetical protein